MAYTRGGGYVFLTCSGERLLTGVTANVMVVINRMRRDTVKLLISGPGVY